jgi:tetraacyldisaccharide-1-P 4'-kinase
VAKFYEKPVGDEAMLLARKHFPVGSNGKRGKAAVTVNALAHMYEIAEETRPISCRGVGY